MVKQNGSDIANLFLTFYDVQKSVNTIACANPQACWPKYVIDRLQKLEDKLLGSVTANNNLSANSYLPYEDTEAARIRTILVKEFKSLYALILYHPPTEGWSQNKPGQELYTQLAELNINIYSAQKVTTQICKPWRRDPLYYRIETPEAKPPSSPRECLETIRNLGITNLRLADCILCRDFCPAEQHHLKEHFVLINSSIDLHRNIARNLEKVVEETLPRSLKIKLESALRQLNTPSITPEISAAR